MVTRPARRALKGDPSIDVRHFQPDPELVIRGALRARLVSPFPKKAPMERFECSQCHQPHKKIKPRVPEDCLGCHPRIPHVGQHGPHLQLLQGRCTACHLPHRWTVTEKLAQEKCVTCHEYREPLSFLH